MAPSRRAFVSLLGLASIGSFSGCSTEPSESPTRATHTTIPCSEWANIPDLSFSTSLSSTRTVEVTITKTTVDTESVVFEQTYTVSPDRTPKTQVIFESARSEGEYMATADVDNGWTAITDVTTVASTPWKYGIQIELNDEADAVFVSPFHSDPGPHDETDCSRAERTATDQNGTQTPS